MGFIVILILTTLAIAGSAAFFSVYGLAQIFTGSFWPVVIMATSLEAGKLVAASYVYRYWKSITFALKAYFLAAILVLMVITSAGIFGFLSAAYQQDIIGTKINEQQVELLINENNQLETLKQERLERKRQIDADIASLPNNYITGRQRLLKSFGPELEQLKVDISEYTVQIRENTKKIAELKAQVLQDEVHVGPIIFIAKVFDQDIDNTTKWLILIIIFAFDPLAVALTVGANIALVQRQNETGRTNSRILEAFEQVTGVDPEQFEDGEPDEPDPGVKSVEQLLEQPTSSVTIDQIKQALAEFKDKELSTAEIAQRGMLEEMLNRKQITRRIRTGKQGTE